MWWPLALTTASDRPRMDWMSRVIVCWGMLRRTVIREIGRPFLILFSSSRVCVAVLSRFLTCPVRRKASSLSVIALCPARLGLSFWEPIVTWRSRVAYTVGLLTLNLLAIAEIGAPSWSIPIAWFLSDSLSRGILNRRRKATFWCGEQCTMSPALRV